MTQSIATLGIVVTQKGVAEADRGLDKLTQSGAKAEQQIGKTSKAMQNSAISAKQLQAATRGLPAQFTDIATSLGSGQRPLQVLLQQGGQIKDMFGGIGPAFKAMGGYVLGLINPVTLLAGASAALFIAWKQGADQTAAFNTALIKTGEYAGRSAEQLGQMIDTLGDLRNVSRGDAVEALTAVAETGRFAGTSFDLVSEAAARMQATTGQAVSDTIAAFKKIADDPVDALLSLNKAEHFLTEAQLDRVIALKAEGREQDAVSEAILIYAQNLDEVASKSEAVMPEMTRRWSALKDNVSDAWGEVVKFATAMDDVISKSGTFANVLQRISQNTNLYAMLSGKASDWAFGSSAAGSTLAGAGKSGGGLVVDTAAIRARQKAQEEFDRLALSNLSKRERLEAEIKEIRKLGAKAGKSELEIDKQIANARARYAESLPKGPKKPKGPSDSTIQNARDRFNDMVGGLEAELEGPLERVQQKHLKNMRELEQAAKAGKVSHDDLAAALATEAKAYAKSSEEVRNRLGAEVASLSGPVAQAQSDHENALRRIEELKKLGVVSGAEYNAMLAEEARAFREAGIAAERAADPLRTLLEDMRFELDMIGKSNAERAVMNELRRAGIDIMSAEAQAVLNTARAFEDEAQAKQRSIDLMDDFREGASNALSDFVTGAKSAKDALKDFFDEMVAQISKAIADKWVSQLFGAKGTDGGGSSGGGFLAGLLGSLFGGGRAIGGPVSAGKMYEVNERGGPEMFEANGKQYLMPPTDGRVVPMSQGKGGGVTQNVTFMVQGRIDGSTQSQVAARTYGAAQRATARSR